MFKENPDIYVLGNSRGVFSVWESEFDKKYDLDILNLSFTRLNSESIQYLAKSINKDKTVFIELSSFLSQDPDETGMISPIFRANKGLRISNDESKNAFSRLFVSYNFNNRATLRLLYHIFKTDKNWSQKRRINESIIYKLRKTPDHQLLLKNQFFEFVKFLEEENYNYVFFHAPYHPLVRNRITNLDDMHAQLDTILGNRFIDMTDLVTEDIHFADGIHSNNIATEFIHQEIVDYLKTKEND
jgi:hypothetical protein